MMAGISFEAIIDYAIDFMRIVQCVSFPRRKWVQYIEIKDYKGSFKIFMKVNQVRLT